MEFESGVVPSEPTKGISSFHFAYPYWILALFPPICPYLHDDFILAYSLFLGEHVCIQFFVLDLDTLFRLFLVFFSCVTEGCALSVT
jgi:hypothetical protein